MSNRYRIGVISSIIAFSIVLDQVTKAIAANTLKSAAPKIYLGDFFRLQYAENMGAMLGFGSNWPDAVRFWALTVGPALILIGLLAYLYMKSNMPRGQTIALALIAGGGLSNIIDRIFNDGWVIDFMNMGIGSLRTGIFNFADVSIMTGLGVMLVFGGVLVPEPEPETKQVDPGASEEEPDVSGVTE